MSQSTSHKFWQACSMALCALMVFYVAIGPTPGGDFWLHARIGQLIVANHAIPATMLFPFTEIAEDRFHAHEWLASVLFHGVLALIGERSLPFFLGLLGVAFYGVVCLLIRARGVTSIPFMLLLGLVSLVTERERHTLRPELLSLVWMVAFWYFLERFRKTPRIMDAACAILLCVLWVNCHGSFILAPLLVALFTLGTYIDDGMAHDWKDLHPGHTTLCMLALLLAICMSCLASPFGTELVSFVLDFGSHNSLGDILGEWTPSWDRRLWGYSGLWYALAIWFFTFGFMVTNRSHLRTVELLVFVAFTLLQLKAIRFTVYGGLVCAYVLAARGGMNDVSARTALALNRALAMACPMVMAYSLTWGGGLGSPRYADSIPTKLSDRMVAVLGDKKHHGNVLNMSMYGSELVYRAWPRLKPSIDDRLDTYGLDYTLYQNALLSNAALLDEFVRRYDVRYLLISRAAWAQTLQRTTLESQVHWFMVFADDRTVFVRRSDIDSVAGIGHSAP